MKSNFRFFFFFWEKSECVMSGSFVAPHDMNVVLVWDNSFSLMRSKTVATHVKIIKDAASLECLPPPPEVEVAVASIESPIIDVAPVDTPSEISSALKEGEEVEDSAEEPVEETNVVPPPAPEAPIPTEVVLESKKVENDEDAEQALEQHEVL